MRSSSGFNKQGGPNSYQVRDNDFFRLLIPLSTIGEATMKCTLLKGKYMICCTAVTESYIPSMFELDEYCRRDKHKVCPLYRQAEIDGKIIIMTDMEKS